MQPSNQFFGIKVSQPNVNVNQASDNQLVYKNDFNSTVFYGTNGSSVNIGTFPATGSNGLKLVSAAGNLISQYGQQTDGTSNLKFFNSNGTALAQFGQFADGSIALKVAKTGYNVSVATDDQLIFNSNQNIFKIIQTGTFTFPLTSISNNTTLSVVDATSNGNYFTLNYNLSFTPIVLITELDPSLNTYSGVNATGSKIEISTSGAISLWTQIKIIADQYSLIVARWGGNTSGSTQNFQKTSYKYFILQESAN